MQIPLTKRIFLGYSLVSLITLAMVMIAFHGINTLSSQYDRLNQRLTVLDKSNQIGRDATDMQAFAEFYIANGRAAIADSVNTIYQDSLVHLNNIDELGLTDQTVRIKQHLQNFYDTFAKVREQRKLRNQLVNTDIPDTFDQWQRLVKTFQGNDLTKSELALINSITLSMVMTQSHINRYFTTLDPDEQFKINQRLTDIQKTINALSNQQTVSTRQQQVAALRVSFEHIEAMYNLGVQRVRGYLTLTNVIMAAESYEARYLAQQLANKQQTLLAELQTETEQIISSLTNQLIILSILFMAATLIISTVIGRTIVTPIGQLRELFERLAKGERNIKIPTFQSKDALSALASSAESFRETNVQTQILLDQYQELSTELENKVAQRTSALEDANKKLSELTIKDPLTGLFNRRHLDEEFSQLFSRSQRSHLPLTAIMFDIDHFKKYNDMYGHQAGDECLKQVADLLQSVFHRSTDLVARFGGEEFVVILFDTDQSAAMTLAEKAHDTILNAAIAHTGNEQGVVTICGGVATTNHRGPVKNSETLLKQADEALYQSKELGRNRITLFTKKPTSIGSST